MNWLLALIFPSLDRTVRIKSGHLPGLKAPTAAPLIPKRPAVSKNEATNIQRLYDRYKATHPNPPKARKKSDRGVGF